MGRSRLWWLASVVALTSVMFGRLTAVIQCNDAVAKMVPCETFLLSGDAAPSAACCSAVQSLDKIATTSPPDRKAICRCFKDTLSSFPVNFAKVQLLLKLCKVAERVEVDPNVDCNRYPIHLKDMTAKMYEK
ncbi:non-specific lipid-transfer protein-like [Dorcoceras hygrometricum]|uniref:Non-specific lipid-transfer protein-like n=1 Tax=Dorcoceras hygrometricum TaxID=472368 RepID=A0A2Z7AN97_9LAMI|nr:non-specific lipid-transfer protein-like [Dorcoceras hygrometricum]